MHLDGSIWILCSSFSLDQLTLIEALHFMAFISIGAVPRGTASRHCPEALGGSFDVVDGVHGVIGRSQSGDDSDAGGGGADAAASDVEVLLM